MNGERIFVDTNIVVYAYSISDGVKYQKSADVITFNDCFVSTQVLNEFCNVGIKKLHIPVSIIQEDINNILFNCSLIAVGPETVKHALAIHGRCGYPYYDCLMIASALECECDYLVSEDMQDSQRIENKLTIKNIFKTP